MGCCCSSSRKTDTDTDRTPVYYYCPRTLEQREPLSLNQVTSSGVSPRLFLERNLDAPIPDAYQAPPAQLPYDAGLSCSQPGNFRNCGTKVAHIPIGSPLAGERVVEVASGSLKGSKCKMSEIVGEHDSPDLAKDEPCQLGISHDLTTEEEDVCPTCLEEYDLENPRIITKCQHHFHLSCILEWMERSDTCPVCDQIMKFDMDS